MRAVLLDAFGTLLTLDAPAPLLRALLEERLGVAVTEAQAAAALEAEVAYYRAHMHEGVDPAAVAALQERCAEVLRRALADALAGDERLLAAPTELLVGVLLDSLRFRVFDDVPAALVRLRAAGCALVVASNWDASLELVLERSGLSGLLDGVVASAAAGFAKPDPRLLERALSLAAAALGAPAAEAVHVGDSLAEDVAAARAAGVRPVLLRREGAPAAGARPPRGLAGGLTGGLTVIRSLAELPALIGCEVSSAP